MEFKLMQHQVPAPIVFNYEEIKQELEAKCKDYTDLVYTDDQIKEAKADRANLNKFKDALNSERIRIKKEYSEPLTAFENDMKSLTSIVDTAVKAIDVQVKAFEQKERDWKKQKIQELWEASAHPDWFTFDKLNIEQWLRKSVSLKSISGLMDELIDNANNDMAALSRLPEYAHEAQEHYKKTRDMSASTSRALELARLQKEDAEQREKAKTAEEQKSAEKTAPTPEPVEPAKDEPAYHMKFEADMTLDQAKQLRMFCDSLGITLKRI